MYCDIGVNLTNSRLEPICEQVLAAARQVDVQRFVITGTSLAESKAACGLARQHEGCYATAGVHPHDAANVEAGYIESLKNLAQDPKVVAIGECGLDFNRNYSPPEQQITVFSEQVQLASELDMPLFLHERDAFDSQTGILSGSAKPLRGVAHCFTGDTRQLQGYLDMGLYIGITGWLCDPKRGTALREALEFLPMDRLLLETDAPFLVPKNLPGKVRLNEPKYLPHIAAEVANVKALSLAEVAVASWQNSQDLFGIS